MPEEGFSRAQTTQVGQPWKYSLSSILKWDSGSCLSGQGSREPSPRQFPLDVFCSSGIRRTFPTYDVVIFIYIPLFSYSGCREAKMLFGKSLISQSCDLQTNEFVTMWLLSCWGYHENLGKNWSQLSSLENISTVERNTHSGTSKMALDHVKILGHTRQSINTGTFFLFFMFQVTCKKCGNLETDI